MATIEELAAKVAELEQQMAAITAPPTEYYTSAYSGEEIDAAVKKVSEGLAGGDAIQEIATTSAEESYETYCAKVDAVLDEMPDKTAKLVRAYPPAVYDKAGTTVSLLYKSDANYAVLSNIGSADTDLCGWRMFKQRYPSSSSPAVWMPFEWENPPMKIGLEYRTSERYNSKPVYAKAISFGQAPNATYKDVSHGIENFSQLVSYTGMMGGRQSDRSPCA